MNCDDLMNDMAKQFISLSIDDENIDYERIINYFQIDIQSCKYVEIALNYNHTMHKELAIVGDSVLTLFIVNVGWCAHLSKGSMTNLRQKYTRNSHLHKCFMAIFKDDPYKVDKVIKHDNVLLGEVVCATILESFIGMLFLNFGFNVQVMSFIKRHIIVEF